MTTTRINHTGHAHANTTAARTACRKAMKVTSVTPATRNACTVGNGKHTHEAIVVDNVVVAARCGAGMQRGIRKASTLTLISIPVDAVVSCHSCR